ncbi:hypothetical protein YC2023_079472 [Brassica napus]
MSIWKWRIAETLKVKNKLLVSLNLPNQHKLELSKLDELHEPDNLNKSTGTKRRPTSKWRTSVGVQDVSMILILTQVFIRLVMNLFFPCNIFSVKCDSDNIRREHIKSWANPSLTHLYTNSRSKRGSNS